MKLIDKIKKVIGVENKKEMDITDYTKTLLQKNGQQILKIEKKIAG